ncbi:MAG: GGDEF domain-containing protein [Solirubrobacterales bacterium]
MVARLLAPRDGELVDELGIPNRIHYWVLAAYALSVASAPVIFAMTPYGAEFRNPFTLALCAVGISIAPLFVVIGRRFSYVFKDWVFQLTLIFSIAGTFVSDLATPNMVSPLLTLFLLGPVGAAYYLATARKAAPIIAAGAIAILVTSARIDAPDAMLRGALLAIVTVSLSWLAWSLKRRLIRTVISNREIAERDPLTGAANMRKFEERLSEEIARANRGGEGFALIAFDLDNFKQVNDSFNHSVGDDVLVAAADAIASALEPTDMLVRRGGDEFSVLAPISAGRDIQLLADRACDRIVDARRAVCPGLTPYASAGWVSYQADETASEVLQRGDDALHHAKATAPERRGSPVASAVLPVPGTPLAGDRPRARDSDRLMIADDPMAGVSRLAWLHTIVVTVVCCLVVGLWVLTGATSFAFSLPEIAALASWLLVFAPLGVWARMRGLQANLTTHIFAIGALLMITVSCLLIGDAAPVGTDIYVFMILIAMALLPFKHAVVYLVIGMGLYGAFLVSSGYPFSGIRWSVTAVNVALAGMVLAITRIHTIEAAGEKAELARTDPLTGLPNTRRLRDRLEYEIRRSAATGGCFALLMFDLDDFKSVNDRHSHSVGDRVLTAVAEAIESTARQADMPARRGGDEFAVVMTEAAENDALLATARITTAVERARIELVPDVNPGVSVGWVVSRPGESVDDLLARADAALHEAKNESYRDRRAYADLGLTVG